MERHYPKFIIVLSLIIIFIGGAGYFLWNKEKMSVAYQQATAGLSEKEALLVLDYGDDKERWFKGEIQSGMTVANVIQASSMAGNFDYKINSHVFSLDGVASNGSKNWHCYLNSEQVDGQIAKQKVNPKDKIVCKYQ
jgi:cbb3-type cytochrome oxidase subunit 3